MRREWLIYPALLLITVAVFWPVNQCQFINYDDQQYVTENPHIRQGLTRTSIVWALGAVAASNWHPVTWLSLLFDYQVFGINARAFHLINLLFHAANALLVFHVFRRMTRELWPSALLAALFALHPLHVESVAWVSERKDVLSTFFGLLALLAYARFAQSRVNSRESRAKNAAPAPDPRPSTLDYFLALIFFALGLMSKPMLVTLPFVMLLLDFWPLGRISIPNLRLSNSSAFRLEAPVLARLIWEKSPFFALAIASSIITFFAQRNAMIPVNNFTISGRIGNALVSYVRYLGKTVWPDHLACFYPPTAAWAAWQIIGSAGLLLLITVAAVWQMQRRPYLIFGWLWFLGTLVPVIGLVQVGMQALADRYSYIPLIGVFVMMVWGLKDFAGNRPHGKLLAAATAIAALTACIAVTSPQLRYWRNSEALSRHALDVTTDNFIAHSNLGDALIDEGNYDEAIAQLHEALRIKPHFADAHGAIAFALAHQGKIREAIDRYDEALRYNPDLPDVANNLAWTLATWPDANIRNGARAVQLAGHACELTDYQKTIFVGTLAAAYAEAGRFDDAITTAQKACALASAAGEQDLLQKNRELLELYRAHKPYHEVAATNQPGPATSGPLSEGGEKPLPKAR